MQSRKSLFHPSHYNYQYPPSSLLRSLEARTCPTDSASIIAMNRPSFPKGFLYSQATSVCQDSILTDFGSSADVRGIPVWLLRCRLTQEQTRSWYIGKQWRLAERVSMELVWVRRIHAQRAASISAIDRKGNLKPVHHDFRKMAKSLT